MQWHFFLTVLLRVEMVTTCLDFLSFPLFPAVALNFKLGWLVGWLLGEYTLHWERGSNMTADHSLALDFQSSWILVESHQTLS